MSKKANRVINGTHGAVWVNGEKWLDLESIELKVTLEYEDVYFSEDTGKHRKFMGWVGEGSIVTKKVYSRGTSLLAKAVKTGIMPEVTVTTKLSDPASYGTERTTVSGVTFNEFLLAKMEQRTLLQEELPFEFTDFDILESIIAAEGMAA
ncbi:phage tail tube protein [Lysinibacillus sp. 3P01SB]|uniref:phage tail tube protein n=1 Tax=Lysinibacillus sp. 3P01SB TaxID=3132284 RepID=UPI0039A446B0